jgi:hypothetical protein
MWNLKRTGLKLNKPFFSTIIYHFNTNDVTSRISHVAIIK